MRSGRGSPPAGRSLSRLDTLVRRPPGQGEEYSNLGYAVLGAALTAASGATYEELVTEYVLRPLDLTEISSNPDPDRRLLPPDSWDNPADHGRWKARPGTTGPHAAPQFPAEQWTMAAG
ncbi:serine hydrolase domain-containing protein [Streptomyces sp. NPDC006622]|uniref:serine hydrolase domain-containing protein n=1 Tax=Streptomyces sp. NPDC006622 TaxID=3155459 RepID=UPI00339E2DCD